jgi:RNA polymerase sigma factor (sigma-70 family)
MSFEVLLRRLSPVLKRIAFKLNGHFTFMDHEDLFQEALVHLWTDHGAGKLDDKTDSYILQGCYYHLRNYIRKMQDNVVTISLNGIAEEEGSQVEEVLAVNSPASLDYIEGVLQIAALEASGITERERKVLFFSLEGMTTREIGKALGISHVSVVKMRNRIKERYERLNGIETLNTKNVA